MTCPKCGEAMKHVDNVLGKPVLVHSLSESRNCGQTKKRGNS